MTGADIKSLREALGLSSAQLGRLCSVSPSTVHRWEEAEVYAVPELQRAILVRLRNRIVGMTQLSSEELGRDLMDAVSSGGVLHAITVLMENGQ